MQALVPRGRIAISNGLAQSSLERPPDPAISVAGRIKKGQTQMNMSDPTSTYEKCCLGAATITDTNMGSYWLEKNDLNTEKN